MAITSYTRVKSVTRAKLRSIEKESSGIIVKNEAYASSESALDNTATNRQAYPGTFTYEAFEDNSDAKDKFDGLDKYFTDTFEVDSWFRETGSETS